MVIMPRNFSRKLIQAMVIHTEILSPALNEVSYDWNFDPGGAVVPLDLKVRKRPSPGVYTRIIYRLDKT